MPVTIRRRAGFRPQTEYALEVPVGEHDEVRASRAEVYRVLNQIETAKGEWCGLPMPLPGLGLVVEDRYPHHEKIRTLQAIIDEDTPTDLRAQAAAARAWRAQEADWKIVNSWYTLRYKGNMPGEIYVLRHKDGRVRHSFRSTTVRRNKLLFGPLETVDAWDLQTEVAAMHRLQTLVSRRTFTSYVLTGCFLERSRRSNLMYFFRRLKPTIVLSPHRDRFSFFRDEPVDDDEVHILTTLCLHPLAYYATTVCGAMVPTDDVIAHLLLMRGDEPLFWKRAVHHAPIEAESGL